jgi:hypothetical protein
VAIGIALGLVACADPAADFIGDRRIDLCGQVHPACDGSAGCILDSDEYLEGDLPGSPRFLVVTDSEALVRVSILFTEQGSPGADTRLTFYEPDCIDRFEWTSDGVDLFRDAGPDAIFEVTGRVARLGEHLVQLRSDAVAHYHLRAEVRAP